MLDVLGLARQYNFRCLETSLSAHFQSSLTVGNICVVYDAAILYELEGLITACLRFMDQYAVEILDVSDFLNLSQAALERLLSRDSFFMPELRIFNCLQAWLLATEKQGLVIAASQHAEEDLAVPALVADISFGASDTVSHTMCTSLDLSKIECDAENGEGHTPEVVTLTCADTPEAHHESPSDTSLLSLTTSQRLDHKSLLRRNQLISNCIRFELMSLSELSKDVRITGLVSSDTILDAISAQTQKCID